RRQAAEQFLRGGRVGRGFALLWAVLASLGVPVPASPRWALLDLVLNRIRLGLRGTRFVARPAGDVDPRTLLIIDLFWSAHGLSLIDPVRGADFQVRSLLRALRAGEPVRVARALASEAAQRAAAGWEGLGLLERGLRRLGVRFVPEVETLITRAEALA